MASSSVVKHGGKDIVLMDISNSMDYRKSMEALKQAVPLIRTKPEGTVLGLLDISGSPYNKDLVMYLKDFAEGNKPYIKMTAVVGVEGLKKIILDSVIAFTRRKNIVTKNTRHEAMEFLAGLQ